MNVIEAVVNLHREGELARPSLVSALQSLDHARQTGLSGSLTLVLDRSDAITLRLAEEFASKHGCIVQQVEYGDLALSRNHAVEQGDSEFIGFLDGDDLWSANWLTASLAMCRRGGEGTICHPAWNVIFGTKQMLFPQPDQTDRKFSYDGLKVMNYWTALSFASRTVYRTHPYKPNRLDLGFGFEDWAWNLLTISHGCVHRAVPETSHYIRYKESDSLRDQTRDKGCLRTPHDLSQIIADRKRLMAR